MNDLYPVTAIVNCHNSKKCAKLTPKALQSILNQDFNQPFEVILVNDGPPINDIRDMAEEWDGKFEAAGIPFRFMSDTYESGYQCHPKNIATFAAVGEFISYLDYDNEWFPLHLQSLYDAHMDGDVWPDFTYGRREYVYSEGFDGKVTTIGGDTKTLPEGVSPFVPWDDRHVQHLLLSPLNNFIDTSDFMITKGALWRMQTADSRHRDPMSGVPSCMWNEGVTGFGDWELIMRGVLGSGLRGKAVDKVVSRYHWHGDNAQITRTTSKPQAVKAVTLE